MANATSESSLYIGLYLPGDRQPTTAALLKLQRDGLRESGHLAYGLGYMNDRSAIALNPLHLPLRREGFALPDRLLRDGGAMPLTVKDALPDAWGRLVIAHHLGDECPASANYSCSPTTTVSVRWYSPKRGTCPDLQTCRTMT